MKVLPASLLAQALVVLCSKVAKQIVLCCSLFSVVQSAGQWTGMTPAEVDLVIRRLLAMGATKEA